MKETESKIIENPLFDALKQGLFNEAGERSKHYIQSINVLLKLQAAQTKRETIDECMEIAKAVAEDNHNYFGSLNTGYMKFYTKLINSLKDNL